MKITKATLKKLAKRNELEHIITSEFDGMVDGMSKVKEVKVKTTIENIDFFFVTKNYLNIEEPGVVRLTNCCFRINFYHESFKN